MNNKPGPLGNVLQEMFRRTIALLMTVILVAGCAHHSNLTKEPAVKDSPFARLTANEAQIGRQIHQQITSAFQMYTEPRVVGYISRVGKSLGRVSDRKELPYLFTVLYDDRVYATGAPGGFVYITTGYLNFLQNEAELAAVLAQEIALIQDGNHNAVFRRRAVSIVAQTGAIAAPFFGPIGALVAGALVLLNAANESSIPTQDQRVERADRKAVHYMLNAGYDPQGYLDLLGQLSNPQTYWSPYLYDYSISHPMTPHRYQLVMKEFSKLPLADRSFNVHRERFLDMTKGVREIYQ